MSKTRPFRELAAKVTADPVRRAQVEAYERVMGDILALARLRQDQGVSQHEVAQVLDVSQANISRIEHEEDIYLSTLRRYVAALGGKLEINAVFPDRTVSLIPARR